MGTISCLADMHMHVKATTYYMESLILIGAETPAPRHVGNKCLQQLLTIEALPFE